MKVQVTSAGSAQFPYGLVTFKVETKSAPSKDGLSAKKLIEETSQAILAYVQSLVSDGVLVTHKYSLVVEPVTNYHHGASEFLGYAAKYQMEFVSDKPSMVSDIQDILTSYPFTRAEAPTFSVKDSDALRSAAESNAWNKVMARFTNQHRTIFPSGNIEDWEVVSWNCRSDKGFSKGAAPTEESEGVVQAECSLTVDFVKKAKPTRRANDEDDGC